MKIKHFFIALVSVIAFSCSSDDNPTADGTFNFDANIDGVDWNGPANTVVTSVGGLTITTIGAGKADGSAFALIFNAGTAGTYDLAGGFGTYTTPDRTVFRSSAGTLTITKFETNKISGTFSFTGTDALGAEGDIEISQGSFVDVNIE